MYKAGDIVIRRNGGQPFKVHMYSDFFATSGIVPRGIINEPGVCDVHLNWVRASEVILLDVYNSPLFSAMKEN